MKTEASLSDSWIKPKDLNAYQFGIWRKRYWSGEKDYQMHYVHALQGNHISVARMEWFADACAIARLKGGAYAD